MPQRTNLKQHAGLAGVVVVASAAFLAIVLFVVLGLSRGEPPTFVPTSLELRPAHGRLVGPVRFTIDATTPDRWRFFSFDDGTVVENPGPLDWDLAFRRFQVIVNGGPGFAGVGGVLDLGEAAFDGLNAVPTDGYTTNTVRSDTVNAALADWYDYSYFSHLLMPKSRVFAVRTADGHHAKLEFVGYYCPGAQPGCVTFRYAYQGAGGVELRDGLVN